MDDFLKQYHPPGTAPGTLQGAIEPESRLSQRFHLLDYTESGLEERELADPRECLAYLARPSHTWIHLGATPDAGTLGHFGELFGLHPLGLEDVVNVGQRPKVDAFEDHLLVILNRPVRAEGETRLQQVSLFLTGSSLITCHSGESDPFEPVRRRLRQSVGRIRSRPIGYLLYALMDLVVDTAFPVLDEIGTELAQLEEALLTEPNQDRLHRLHGLRQELLLLRQGLWPQRDVLAQLLRDEEGWLADETKVYLRDAYQHAVQVLELTESYREMAAGLLDIYLSSASRRLSEVMRVLTVFATIFLPLTFIAGIYGMNFAHMPELGWRYGYPTVLGLMAAMAGGLLAFFRHRGWI